MRPILFHPEREKSKGKRYGLEPPLWERPISSKKTFVDFAPTRDGSVERYDSRRAISRESRGEKYDSLQGPTEEVVIPMKKRRFDESKYNNNRLSIIHDVGRQKIPRRGRPVSVSLQRNNLPCKNPGDKLYNHPVLSPNFFKMEGIVVGQSAFRKRQSYQRFESPSLNRYGKGQKIH